MSDTRTNARKRAFRCVPIEPGVPQTAAVRLHADLQVPGARVDRHGLHLHTLKVRARYNRRQSERAFSTGLSVWHAITLKPLPAF